MNVQLEHRLSQQCAHLKIDMKLIKGCLDTFGHKVHRVDSPSS